jgi:hypothetical protein
MSNKTGVRLGVRITGAGSGAAFTTATLDDIVIGGGALPVTMVSFNAAAIPNGAEIRWSTATEVNSASFEVERRLVNVSGGSWMTVGSVAAAGNSSSPRDYSYTDNVSVSGTYAYRLKQIDNGGASSYFGSAEVSIGAVAREFALNSNYPNPFNPTTQISFTVPENGRAVLRVFNVIGQEVATLLDRVVEAGFEQRATFNAAGMPSGLYFARLEFGNQAQMKRMMLVK